MNMSKIFTLVDDVAKSKSIEKDRVIEVFKYALEKAYLKEFPDSNVEVIVDDSKGLLELYELKTVVDKSEDDIDDDIEITLEEARKENPKINLNDIYKFRINIDKFERRVATHVLSIFQQKMNEITNVKIFEKFKDDVGKVVSREVDKVEKKYVEVKMEDSIMGVLPPSEQIPNEDIKAGRKYAFLIKNVKEQSKGWPIVLSRTDNKLLEFLLKTHVPEIDDGTIEIKAIARVPGNKAKVAIKTNNPNIDAIGTCVGNKGERIKNISKELNNEKIDVFLYDENPKQLLINATSPEQIIGLEITDDEDDPDVKYVTIVCKDDEDLAKMIGKMGVNVKLLSMLTKWNIDIVTQAVAIEDKIDYEDVSSLLPQRNSRRVNVGNNNNNKWNQRNKPNNNNIYSSDDLGNSNYDDNWNSSNSIIDSLTDEDVEKLLNSNDISKKKKKKVELDDEDEVVFISKKDIDNEKSFVNENDYKESESTEENSSTEETKSEAEIIQEEKEEEKEVKTYNNSSESIDDFFDEPNTKEKDDIVKHNVKSSKKPKKEKVNIFDEFDVSEDDYDDSAETIDIDDLDYDDLD